MCFNKTKIVKHIEMSRGYEQKNKNYEIVNK